MGGGIGWSGEGAHQTTLCIQRQQRPWNTKRHATYIQLYINIQICIYTKGINCVLRHTNIQISASTMQRQQGNTGVLAPQAACTVRVTMVLVDLGRKALAVHLFRCRRFEARSNCTKKVSQRAEPGKNLTKWLEASAKFGQTTLVCVASFLHPLRFILLSCRRRSRLCRWSHPCSAFNGRSWPIPSKTRCTPHTPALLH